jgi:protein KTI12
VKRLLGKEDVVILDGLNYIKGFRYQLYCEAKTVLTRSCVVHVAAPVGVCREWNSVRGAETEAGGGWEEGLLEELVSRYEEPNGMSRWDSPLFTVPYVDESPDCEGIWRAVVDGGDTVVRANQGTVLRPAEEGEYLHELGRVTQEVVRLVLERQRGGGGGGVMPVPGCAVVRSLGCVRLSSG